MFKKGKCIETENKWMVVWGSGLQQGLTVCKWAWGTWPGWPKCSNTALGWWLQFSKFTKNCWNVNLKSVILMTHKIYFKKAVQKKWKTCWANLKACLEQQCHALLSLSSSSPPWACISHLKQHKRQALSPCFHFHCCYCFVMVVVLNEK